MKQFILIVLLATLLPLGAQELSLDSLQRKHAELRFGMFIHFNMNTFWPGWAETRTEPTRFSPTNLDCNQWAKAAKAAGMTYAILTTKHHDGFALWPTKQVAPNGLSTYSVAQSSVPNKDIVMEYVTAFRAQGLEPCFYFSMWDVANGVTGNWAKEKAFVLGQLTELLGGKYGQIPLLVIDGWAWSMGHQSIPYQEVRDSIKKLQPNILIADHNGLTSPWEEDIVYYEEPKGMFSPITNKFASCQGTTISGDWFWNSDTPDSTKLLSLNSILDHLKRLEPVHTNMLLNCPPNRAGQLDLDIVNRLAQVGAGWKPDLNRPLLSASILNIEHPIQTKTALATSGTAGNAIDGKSDCSWSNSDHCNGPIETLWSSNSGLPQAITLDFGSQLSDVGILGYLPSQSSTNGAITSYTIAISTDNSTYTTVSSGIWPVSWNYRTVSFPPAKARYIRLTATATADNNGVAGKGTIAIASEIDAGFITSNSNPTNLAHHSYSAQTKVQNSFISFPYFGTTSLVSPIDGTLQIIRNDGSIFLEQTVRKGHNISLDLPHGMYFLHWGTW